MSQKNPRLPHVEMSVELYETKSPGDRLSYRLFIDGEPVEFERLRGAKRLLADALLELAVSDHKRRKSMNVVDPNQIPGPPGRH